MQGNQGGWQEQVYGGGPNAMAQAMAQYLAHGGVGGLAEAGMGPIGGGPVDSDGWQIPPNGWGEDGGGDGAGGGANRGPPPASTKVLARLPVVKVTPADLEQDANDSCSICMEEHVVGAQATKLPCGHIYHHKCVQGWLEKHCTCPVCRYEMDTEDHVYEEGRKGRMRQRSARYRQSELAGLGVRALKQLSASLEVDITGCFEKREIVSALVASGRVSVVAESDQPTYAIGTLNAMSVSELRRFTGALGVDCVGCLTKEDMVERLIQSEAIKVQVAQQTREPGGGGEGGGGGGGCGGGGEGTK